MKKSVVYLELSSKHNVDILGIKTSTWKQHDFETTLTYNDVMDIQDEIGKVFESR